MAQVGVKYPTFSSMIFTSPRQTNMHLLFNISSFPFGRLITIHTCLSVYVSEYVKSDVKVVSIWTTIFWGVFSISWYIVLHFVTRAPILNLKMEHILSNGIRIRECIVIVIGYPFHLLAEMFQWSVFSYKLLSPKWAWSDKKLSQN